MTKIKHYTAVIALVCAMLGCSRTTPVGDVFPPGEISPSLVSITVTPQTGSIAQGATLQLIVTGQFSDKTSRTLLSGLSWTSSATDVLTVDNAGQVTGVKVGQATITVTSGTLVVTATITVVPLALQAIAVTPTDEFIFVKGQRQFTATGTFNNGTSRDLTAVETVWNSSNTGIATIDSNGIATGVAPGMITISVTAPTLGSVTGTVITGATTFLVKGVTLAAISITPKLDSLIVGTTKLFTVKGTYSDGHTEILTSNLIWSTSNAGVATVDVAGQVTGVATGTAQISAAVANLAFPPPAKATVSVISAQPTALLVTPLNPAMVIGDNQSFTATMAFDNNTIQDVTSQASWTSSNTAVALVDNTTGNKGKVSASESGTTVITATLSGKTGTTSVTVLNGTLQSISVTPLNRSIPSGTTQQFKAEGVYTNGLTRDITSSVTWTSSNSSVSIVPSTGLATGGSSVGTATITATSGTTSGTTSLTVTSAVISSLYITPLFPSIYKGDNQQFTAIGVFSDGTTYDITDEADWTSSHPLVATIDGFGEATGEGIAGTSTIIQAEFSGKSGTTTLTVKSATLMSMEIVPPNPIIPPGGVISLLAIGTFSDGSIANLTNTASWLSFPQNIAVVDNGSNKGEALGLTNGTTTIQAMQGATFTTTNLTVTSATLTKVSVTPADDSIPVGIRRQFTATAQFSDGSALDITASAVWSTADASMATVDNEGLVQGVSPGNVVIHAAYLGQTGTSTLNVNTAALTSISVTPAGSTLGVGLTRQYMATANYSGSSYDVTADAGFTSGSPSILGVTPTGLATGVNPGQTNIKASFRGTEGSTTVEVKALTLKAIRVTPAESTVPKGGTLQYTATGEYADDGFTEDLTGVVSWSSTLSAVATIGGNTGIATGIDFGPTTIQAVFGAFSTTTTLSVIGAVAKEVTAGGDHTCGVRTDSSLRCWGKNFSGQMGKGNNDNAILADPVSLPNTVAGVVAGGAHTCAFLKNGSASCWGANQKGQLGDGTNNAINLPKSVPNLSGVRAMAAGLLHTCAILNNNTVSCWGDNSSGQLGNGSSATESKVPVSVNINVNLVPSAITAGGAHTCMLYTNGSVECWGENNSGQLGIGTTSDSSSPLSVNLGGTATAITAGGNHTCALLSVGTVKCWGENSSGQLGDSTTTNRNTPVAVSGLTNVTAVLAGGSHTCALVNAKVKCWGENSTGQLGDGTTPNITLPNNGLLNKNTPVDVSIFLPTETVVPVVDIGVGGSHSCALIQGGETRCWGSNRFGQLGLTEHPNSPVPVNIPGITSANDLYGGRSHTCVVLNNNTVKCMGNNQAGQLGDGTTTHTELTVDVSGMTTATSTALGDRHTCAVLSTGEVKCWGENTNGQLGNGNNMATTTPVSMSITTARAVSAGGSHTCALLLSLNTIHCWGNNSRGQLGNNSTTNSPTPVQVGTLTAIAVSAGHDHTCALLSSGGAVQCWGDNTDGRLGNGNTTITESLVPLSVINISNATAIAAGGSHTCALLSDKTMKCWGDNTRGQLGNWASSHSASPLSVLGMTTAEAIAAGGSHTCALLSNKTIQCWGSNDRGQLGTGNITTQYLSQPGDPVSGISTATSIHAGTSHACAHLEDNTVRCWGDAESGQLGSSNGISIHTTPSTVQGI